MTFLVTDRPGSWLAALVFLFLTCAAASQAQLTPIVYTDFGYVRQPMLNHYTPITVTIDWTGEDAPGESRVPISAVIECTLPQDSVYETTTSVPVTITPGRKTTITVYLWSAGGYSALVTQLRDADGSLLAQFDQSNGPGISGRTGPVVLIVGAREASWGVTPVASTQQLVFDLVCARTNLKPEDLPRTWLGYDGVPMVIIRDLGNAGLDAAQIEALERWVEQGGDLVIQATSSLEAYQLLAQKEFGLNVPMGEFASERIGQDRLISALQATAAVNRLGPAYTGSFNRESNWGQDGVERKTINRRVIELTDDLVEAGWNAWYCDQSRDQTRADMAHGDTATGPVGHGSITIVTTDPTQLAGSSHTGAQWFGWIHVLQHTATIRRVVGLGSSSSRPYNYGRSFDTTVSDAMQSGAVNAILDDLSVGVSTQSNLFSVVAFGLLFLVLLVGPVDYFVLKWLGREPWTWATCTVLVVLSCAVLVGAQASISISRTRLNRVSCIDVIPGSTQSPISGITAVISPRTAMYHLENSSFRGIVRPVSWTSSWWTSQYSESARRRARLDQSSLQTTMRPMRIAMGTVAWFIDEGWTATPDMSASISVNSSSASMNYTLHLRLSDPGIMEHVSDVAVRSASDKWYCLQTEARGFDWQQGDNALALMSADSRPWAGEDRLTVQRPVSIDYSNEQAVAKGQLPFLIGIHRGITDRLVNEPAAGGDAAVFILLEDADPGVTLSRNGRALDDCDVDHHRIYRLIAPVEVFNSTTPMALPDLEP